MFFTDLWHRSITTPRSAYPDWALLIGRVLIVLGLLPNGIRKIVTFAQTAAGMGGTPQIIDGRVFPDQMPLFYFPAPELFLGASVAFDLIGAILVIVGFKTRAVALWLTFYVAIAMTIYHSDIRGAQDIMHLIRNIPFLAGLLVLSGVGAGHLSLDGMRLRRDDRVSA